jgi:hypothetical protein
MFVCALIYFLVLSPSFFNELRCNQAVEGLEVAVVQAESYITAVKSQVLALMCTSQ